MVALRHYRVASVCLTLTMAAACKTPSRNANRSDLSSTENNILRLKDFSHEVSATPLKSLGSRVGCRAASRFMLYPTSGSIKSAINAIYQSAAPYDTVLHEMFNSGAAERACNSSSLSKKQDPAHAMGRLIASLKAKNLGLTFVMVGGFGSHLTDEGALYESRRLWQARFGSDAKYFRVVRHECEPNSFATDDVCSPLLIKRFKDLESSRGDIEHRYLFWGYSKGGSSLLKAFSLAPEMREKALALVTVGSPIGGGLPVSIARPILEQIAKKKAALSPAERATLNTLLTFGSGSPLDFKNSALAPKLGALLEDRELETLRAGFDSLAPDKRKQFIETELRTWNFTRKNLDPITNLRNLPIFHVAAAVDIAKLDPVPVLTVNSNGDIVTLPSSQNMMHLAELATLTKFRNHPLSDTCVALEHSVIPKGSTPPGAEVKLLAVLNMDHMSLGLSKEGAQTKQSIPHLEIVDSLMEGVMVHLGIASEN